MIPVLGRRFFLNTAETWLHIRIPGEFQTHGCLDLSTMDSDLTALKCSMGINIFKGFPGDSMCRATFENRNTKFPSKSKMISMCYKVIYTLV